MRHERPCRRASQNRMHHRRFHFHVAALVEKPPQLAHDLRTPHENFPRPFVHDQVEIAPPEPLLHVRKSVPFFRQRQQRFAQKFQSFHPHGQLIGLGPEQVTRNADDVAQIEQLEQLERLLTDDVELYVDLQASPTACQMRKCCFSVRPQRDDPPRHAHFDSLLGQLLTRSLTKLLHRLLGCVRPIELMGVGRVP